MREVLATGGAGVGAIAGMATHVLRQAAGVREGLAAGGPSQLRVVRPQRETLTGVPRS